MLNKPILFIEVLATLDKKELQYFVKWLNSPWCNSNKNLVILIEVLKPFYPTFKHKKFTKEYLKEKVGNKEMSESSFQTLMFNALCQIKKFLTHHALTQDENDKEDFLSRELEKRHLNRLFFKTSDKAIKRLEIKSGKSWEDYTQLIKHYRRQYHSPGTNPYVKNSHYRVAKGMDENLKRAYFIQSGIILNEMYNLKRILNLEEIDTDVLKVDSEKWLYDTEGNDHVSVILSQMCLQFFRNENGFLPEYEKLKVFYLNQVDNLSPIDQKIHLIFLLNVSKRLRRMGLLSITSYFPLYKVGIEKGILLHFGKLGFKTFTSILIICNWEKQFVLSQFFIDNYLSDLPEHTQEDCEKWSLAHTAYSKNRFGESLTLLNEHKFQIPYFKIISRGLRLQIYFEDFIKKPFKEKHFILNYCKSFINWIRIEKTMSPSSKKPFTRFVQAVQKMIKEYSKPDFEEEKFLNILEEKKNIQGLDWLKAKRDEILKIKKPY